MRVINLVDGIDVQYEYFNLMIINTSNGFFEIIACNNFTSKKVTIATCDRLNDAETIMKNIGLAYEKGVKSYFIE